MRAILKTYDPVTLNFAETLLKEAGIDATVLDGSLQYIEAMSWPAKQLVVLVDEDVPQAQKILSESLPDWDKIKI